VFRSYQGEKIEMPKPVDRPSFIADIHKAQFKSVPANCKKLSSSEIERGRKDPLSLDRFPKQEQGNRPACPLPYELAVDGSITADGRAFAVQFAAGTQLFGERSAGAPFRVYSPAPSRGQGKAQFEQGRTWDYAVSAGDTLSDKWLLSDFENGIYHLRVHGPNGFFREFRGSAEDPQLSVKLEVRRRAPNGPVGCVLELASQERERNLAVTIRDLSYGRREEAVRLKPGSESKAQLVLDLSSSQGWYDFEIRVEGLAQYTQRYAGRVETGMESTSDPLLARA
jgi:phospholipase C